MESKEIHIFALAAHGEGISGGDRIFIEFARHWSKKFPVIIFVWEEGARMLKRQQLGNFKFRAPNNKLQIKILKMRRWCKFGFIVCYFARILEGIRLGLTLKIENPENIIVYSASEFWMDSMPALVLKLRYPKIIWAAAWYQTAPNPLKGFKEGDRIRSYRFSALAYWLVQLPVKPLIKRWADFILVNNEFEKKQFPDMNKQKKVIVILGAVDLPRIKDLMSHVMKGKKIYDGVFQGRFHPQKGIIELIDIWRLVVDKKPDAKLALIGDGPLMKKVKINIDKLNLQKNIKLFGYVFDGVKKYQLFAQSKVVLHPAFYDSGGMASAEAMALGLPAVGFNLNAYKSYYPKGMVKVPINNLQAFAGAILELLKDKRLYSKTGNEAKRMIAQNWSWDKRSEQILNCLK